MVYDFLKSFYIRFSNGYRYHSHTFQRIVSLLSQEAEKWNKTSARDKLRAWRQGYLSESYLLLDLENDSSDRYLSDWNRSVRSTRINKPHTNIHEDKLLFYHVLHPTYREYLPKLYGIVREGILTQPAIAEPIEADTVRDLVDNVGSVIAKPIDGARGQGVTLLEHRAAEEYTINREPASASEVDRLQESMDQYLVTEVVNQADYANEIYSDAANTIRMMTMVDPKTDESYVGAAVHRFGTDESTPVDNYSDGGVVVDIDIETGILGSVAQRPGDEPAQYGSTHPDSGVHVEDTEIPGWDQIAESILKIADNFKDLTPYLGWDLIVTDTDGSFKIIEANSLPDVHAIQTHQPLLANKRNRQFYEYHGVVKNEPTD
jgi:hypothetical protein